MAEFYPADFTTSEGAQELLSQLLDTHISQERWHNYLWQKRLTAYLFRDGAWEKYTPGEREGLQSGFLYRLFDIYTLAMDEMAKKGGRAKSTEPKEPEEGAVPQINFRNSEGAAQYLTKLLGRENKISHDSMRQYALRGRIPAYFFKDGVLVKYQPGMSAQGAASGFLFFDHDIEELARSSQVGVGRDGYPDWVKEWALSTYYEEMDQWRLNEMLPPHQRDPMCKKPSYRDIAARITVPWREEPISWMTLRNWDLQERAKRDKALIDGDNVLIEKDREILRQEDLSPLLSAAQAAEQLRVSVDAIRKWLKEGAIPGVIEKDPNGRSTYYVLRSAIEDLLSGNVSVPEIREEEMA